MTIDLSMPLAPSLELANPVMVASGTFGYGTEYGQVFDIQKLGAIICKGTTLKPREGNPQPRLVETTGGVINSIGLQNVGIETVLQKYAPLWAGWDVPVIVNIAGESIEEYRELAARLNGVPGISGIELNISCPNIKCGGAAFGSSPQSAAEVTAAVRAVTSLPLIVKLTPNTGEIGAIASAVAASGADAVSLINSIKAMAIDVSRRRPVLGTVTGGLSGPAIKPIALAFVYEVAGTVRIPVIGCGGITTASDALEFIMAGASAVQIGSATFARPRAALDVLEGIQEFMAREGIRKLTELIGAARY